MPDPCLREGAAGVGLPWRLRGVLIDGTYLAQQEQYSVKLCQITESGNEIW